MEAAYDPKAVEGRWYPVWEEAGAFRPELNPEGDPFCIVIPPPNVTGVLHMGHALDLTIQDVIIRRKRMQGMAALWVPGTDHAGIATQNVVERELAAEGLDRHDLGRVKFVEQVWLWKERSGNRITEQMRAMGFSCDWSRERFTMDEGLSRAVLEVFVSLYEEGLIYRANRIINWCIRCHTALSEIEVDHEEEVGELVHITYPFADGDGGIEVATTRAETMLGDTAVAVHPEDERYREAVGREVVLPLMERRIPVVADEAVERDFGTGAVKVTPAHDPLDFEIAGRHGLEPIKILDETGIVTEAGGRFAGLERFGAREAVKAALAESGVLGAVEPHVHSVGHCSRCKSVVEPMLSLQWFVKVEPLVGPALAAVRSGATRFTPRRWENNYFHWMENLRDWCISRQLWWGHRIPAWYCDDCDEVIVSRTEPTACPACDGSSLTPDEDVLDTWFSSALWPFSTLGWPEDTDDLHRFYPNSVLVTGFDIIYFWVARMMKMGIHFTGQPPYPDVVIHGLVRAPDGRKMSKSLNNAVDPLDLVDRYGADALRLALLQAAAPGQDVPFQEDWVDAARRFGNKLWNATRFALNHIEGGRVPPAGGYPDDPGPEDEWILARLREVSERADQLLDEHRFSDAFALVYSFAWSEVFDWYLEMAKMLLRDPARAEATRTTLGVVLRDVLQYLHPAMPFVTEELWGELVGAELIATSTWPAPPVHQAPAAMDSFQQLVVGVRRFRADHGLSPRAPITLLVDGQVEDWWGDQARSLASIEIATGPPSDASGYSRVPAGGVDGFIELSGLVDVDAERPRLERAIAETEKDLETSRRKLAKPEFRERAPAAVVAKEEEKSAEFEQALEKLRAQLAELG
jgi:valyl-tRNA synthetase